MNSIFILAIVAGFLTILAPCILPLLPFLLGTSGGRSKWRPVAIILGFVGTFAVVGAGLATAGSFIGIESGALRVFAVVLLLLFGVALVFETLYEKLTASVGAALARLGAKVQQGNSTRKDVWSGLLVGFSLGLIWTPCAGPILGSILTLAARTSDYVTTLLLMLAYAVGAGVPMLAIAYGSQRLQQKLLSVGKAQPVLNKVFGFLIIAMALAILTGYDLVIQTWLVQFYPDSFISKL
jgi:cytochrome c biogenesis protein CcdA